MPRPNGGLITETNRQYYAGAQQFYIDTAGAGKTFASTFDTDLIFGSSDDASSQYGLNNFNVFNHEGCVAQISKIQYQNLQDVISFIVENGEVPLFIILDIFSMGDSITLILSFNLMSELL